MATNNNGHLTDDRGNVCVDFVWGGFPLQPNDDRADTNRLDYTLDSHIIADSGWSGYPLFTANSTGSDVAGPTDYITVPSVLGKTTALAIDALKDAGFTSAAGVSTITTASAATNSAVQPTRVNVTATTAATVYVASGTGAYPVGTKVTIAAGTGIPAAVVGTWTVTGGSGSTIVIAGTGWTVADSGSITPGTRLTGASGTIKTQSIAGGAGTVAPGTAITITPWA
jgi:hypothetical protein